MPTRKVNLDVTQYVKVNTGLNPLTLQSNNDSVRITFSELKPAKTNSVFHTVGGNDAPLQFSSIDTNVWVLAVTVNSSLVVTETTDISVTLGDEVVDRTIVQVEVGQNQSIPFPSIRIITNVGVYLNAKTDDDDIHMTIFGHYVGLDGKEIININ